MNTKPQITKEGFQKLTVELDALKQKHDHLITQIEEVAQPDEAGEDSLATQLKEELEVVNDKIFKIEEALESSEVINKNQSNGTIAIGSKVKIKLSGAATKEFHIVSELEADPTQDKISDQSPIGQALIGRKINDEIEVDAPVGKITYKIIAIS